MRFDIITIFPKIFDSYFNESILARAQKQDLIKINAHDLRIFATDKHKTVDDKPYGGGAGMVLKVEPIFKAISALTKPKPRIKYKKTRIILFSAKGRRFTQSDARRLSKYSRLIMICGRYEGVDERVAKHIADEEISIGDYILTGGELPAIVVVDAVSRLIPNVVGKEESVENESFKKLKTDKKAISHKLQAISYLEHPHYTRPEVFSPDGKKKWKTPKVLLSGNHKEINKWREKNARTSMHES